MSKRLKMEDFVKSQYPHAVFEDFFDTVFGTELQFRPCEENDKTYACVLNNGKFVILYDF